MNDEAAELKPLGSGDGVKPPHLTDYEVGYGKPPRRYQFPKGQSGNGKGRPKEVKSLVVYFEKLLGEDDVSARNGARVMSKSETVMRALFDSAAKCNRRAFAKFMRLAKQSGLLERPAAPRETGRCVNAGLNDMKKFKADFGKPLPD